MNESARIVTERMVREMYQIYTLLGIAALLFGIAIWASIPEEQEDSRH